MEKRIERNAGIDILRMLSMFMVVMIHINGAGGIFANTKPLTLPWIFSSLIEQIGIIAVNCFALISGFVNYQKRFKIKNLLSLWAQAFFYSFGITLIFFFIRGASEISAITLVKSIFPVMMNEWWYFSSYFLLFFFIPALNYLIENSSQKTATFFIVIFLINATLVGYVVDIFKLQSGYSPLWLMGLYAIGAFVKKYNFSLKFKNKEIKNYWNLILYFIFVFAGLICTILLMTVFGKNGRYGYNFIINFLEAFFLFLFFSKFKVRSCKFLSWASSLSFAVYLISEHNVLKPYIMIDKFIFLTAHNPIVMLLGILLFALLIYIVCSLVEAVRKILFKALKIDNIFNFLQTKCDAIQEKYFKEQASVNIEQELNEEAETAHEEL